MKKLIRYTKVKTDIGVRLAGVIQDDERFEDNHRVYTSLLEEEYEEEGKRLARTETGSIYELGQEMSHKEFLEEEKDRGTKQGIEILRDLFNKYKE